MSLFFYGIAKEASNHNAKLIILLVQDFFLWKSLPYKAIVNKTVSTWDFQKIICRVS